MTDDLIGQMGGAAKFYFPASLKRLGSPTALVAAGIANDEPCLTQSGVELFLGEATRGELRSRIRTIRVAIDEFRPDIVHVFFHRWAFLYPCLFAEMGLAWVLDIRGPLLNSGFRGIASQVLNNIDSLGYDMICSHHESSVHSIFGYPRKGIRVTRIGVDIDRIKEKSRDRQSTPRFPLRGLYVGSLGRVRQIDLLIDAIAIAHLQCAVQIDIFGDGDGFPLLERKIKELGLADAVNLKGKISRLELYRCLPKYDYGIAYVGPRVYEGAPPLKTLEYMAAGLPVVATNTTGNSTYIRESRSGLLRDSAPEAFAQGIVELASGRLDLASMGREARSFAERYDWLEICKADLLPMYLELCGSQK